MVDVQFQDWGLIDYKEAWDKQESYFANTLKIKSENRTNNTNIKTQSFLIFCEHLHVYTLGKSGDLKNLLLDEKGLEKARATFYKINRGGDITYHGPGQIVGYPILDLDYFFTDIHKYLRLLEEAIINTLKHYNIISGRVEGLTGVWIDGDQPDKARKICAMGVRCSRWVTMHGFAFNVNSDLNYFNNIIPCGIDDKAVTSMQAELGHELNFDEVKSILKNEIAILFNMNLINTQHD
ncbi:MAG: lipoyl(octanoyl) transferase LipB [bacterium]|jgi:lipoyl(octanoyl) transferase